VVGKKLQAEFRKKGYNARPVPDQAMLNHYARAVRAMPEEAAVAEIRRILDLYARGTSIRGWSGLFVPVDSAMRVRIVVEAVRFVDAKQRHDLVTLLPFRSQRPSASDLEKPQLDALLEVIPLLSPGSLQGSASYYESFLTRLDPALAQDHLTAVLRLLPTLDPVPRQFLIRMASGSYKQMPDYLGGILPVAAANAWDILTAAERREFIGQMVQVLGPRAPGGKALGENRAAIGAFVRARYADLDQNLFGQISRYPDLFPPEEWIPLAPTNTQMYMKRDQAENDRIAKALSGDAAKINDVAIDFLRTYASVSIQTEVFERGMALGDRKARQRFTLRLSGASGSPAGIGAIEKTLAAVLAEEAPDLREVSRLATFVLTQRPSEKLFPAASLLLESDIRTHILTGIHIARSLGREDLVPVLRTLLDSMDSQIRTTAKSAIDSIAEIVRIKNEQKLKEAGLKNSAASNPNMFATSTDGKDSHLTFRSRTLPLKKRRAAAMRSSVFASSPWSARKFFDALRSG